MDRFRGLWYALGIALLLAMMLLPVSQNERTGSHGVEMTEGVLDVSRIEFSQGLYELRGTMETYPQRFLSPASELRPTPEPARIPFTWKADSGVTFGSYRFVLTGLSPGRRYAFYLYDSLTAYEIFADGQSIARMGTPATAPSFTKPAIRVQSAPFEATGSRVEIVLHVASHSSHLVGIWQKTLFGPEDAIHRYEVRAKMADAFVNGAILFMTLYVWILFLVMRKDRAILYFALSCSFVTLKSLLSGQQLLMGTYPGIPYEVGLRTAYLMVPAIVVTFELFAREYFQIRRAKPVQWTLQGLSLVQALMLLLLPQRWYQQTFLGYQLIAMLAAVMVMVWAIRAVWQLHEGAVVYLTGFLFFFATGVNDLLFSMQIVQTGYFLGFGLLGLIMSQASILALRMRRALRTEAFLKQHLEQQVQERTRELEQEKERFENLSKIDSLTGLYNKGALMDMIRMEAEALDHYEHPFSIVMVDLDGFKAVNDTHGHVVGDGVLRQVGTLLMSQSRRADFIGRYGGEEFLLVLPFTGTEDALRHAEQLRAQIEALQFPVEGEMLHVTASFGVATARTSPVEVMQLIRRADDAMYEAKHLGKNRVAVKEP